MEVNLLCELDSAACQNVIKCRVEKIISQCYDECRCCPPPYPWSPAAVNIKKTTAKLIEAGVIFNGTKPAM